MIWGPCQIRSEAFMVLAAYVLRQEFASLVRVLSSEVLHALRFSSVFRFVIFVFEDIIVSCRGGLLRIPQWTYDRLIALPCPFDVQCHSMPCSDSNTHLARSRHVCYGLLSSMTRPRGGERLGRWHTGDSSQDHFPGQASRSRQQQSAPQVIHMKSFPAQSTRGRLHLDGQVVTKTATCGCAPV